MNHVVRTSVDEIDAVIKQHVSVPFTSDSTLAEIGIDSLSTLRIVTTLAPDADQEIDLADLVEVRTVGQFRGWIRERVLR